MTIFRSFYYLSRIITKEKSPWWKKTESEWSGKFITVPHNKESKKKRKPIMKKNDNVNFKIWIRKETLLCHYGNCKAPLLHFPARKSHINPGLGLPRAQSIGRERRPTVRSALLYKLSENNRKLPFHFTFQTLYKHSPRLISTSKKNIAHSCRHYWFL